MAGTPLAAAVVAVVVAVVGIFMAAHRSDLVPWRRQSALAAQMVFVSPTISRAETPIHHIFDIQLMRLILLELVHRKTVSSTVLT